MISMQIGQLHHIGYLVKKIESAQKTFLALGFVLEKETMYDEIRKSDICFLKKGGAVVELVAPQADSEIYPLLKKYPNMPYHLCYKVDNLQHAVSELTSQGFLLFKEAQIAPAISDDATVVFLLHRQIGLIELVQGG